jgi:GntR family transcriptional regulator
MSDVLSSERDRRPLSVIVRTDLENLIRQGRFPPGSQLPPEDELASLLSVSRPTLREALGSMETDGLVVRRRGIGTFVSRRSILRNNLDANFGVTDLIEAHGASPGTEGVVVKELSADEEEAARLGVSVGSSVISVERVRTADGLPVVFSIDIFPPEIIPEGRSLEGESMYHLLEELGHAVHHGVAQLIPTSATASLARKLDVPRGSPLLLLDQLDYDAKGRAVLHSREWHVADAFEITVYRKGPKQ